MKAGGGRHESVSDKKGKLHIKERVSHSSQFAPYL